MKGFGPTKLERYAEDVLAVLGRSAGLNWAALRPLTQKKRARKKRRIRKLRLLGLVTVLGLLSCVSFSFGLVRAIASEIPKLDPQRQLDQQVNGYIYDSNRKSPRVLAVLRGSEARTLVSYKDIAAPMRHAIVAIEDRRFWQHDGIDLRGIGRALIADIRHKKVVEGGSTITQQFVKNALDRDQRTIARKVREAALAWQLERDPGGWSKQRILTAYLNTIYFGNGAYGVQQAAMTYFQHGAKDLTIPEAALLAGIPADPEPVRPRRQPAGGEGAPPDGAARDARGGDDHARAVRGRRRARRCPSPEDVHLPGTEGPAQYFVNYVKQQLIDHYGSAEVFGGGLRVTTTIDLNLQQAARDAIAKWLTNPEGPSAALVAIDPRSGAVKAMVGGNNYRDEPVQPRRPGRAPARLVLQAVRARDRAAAGDLAGDSLRLEAADDRPRRQVLAGLELRPRLPRLDRRRAGDDRVRQHRLRAAHPARRVEEGGGDGEAARHPQQARAACLLDRARRRGGQPARARPRVRDLRERGPAGRRRDGRQPAARVHGGERERAADALQRAGAEAGA